jgi:hypothetical protein
MRSSFARTAVLALALAAPTAARAQDPGALPADLARRVAAVLNDADTRRYEGRAEIAAGDEVLGDVAVLDGSLSLGGRVDGDVVVVNGNLSLGAGAQVTGDVVVVGGDVQGQEEARVSGEIVVFAEPVTHCRRGGLVDLGGDCGALASVFAAKHVETVAFGTDDGGWELLEDDDEDGRATFVLAAGRSYNRVEGLPIKFGPAVETAGSNPLRVRALAVFRTEESDGAGLDRWGYDARIEQFFGGRRAFRVGARLFNVVDPIEAGHLTDLENSLTTFFLHQDFRDHYQRRGWTAFATLAPRTSPFSVTGEFREERHHSVAPGSPWALLRNDESWRPQPLVAEGRMRSVAAVVAVDDRSEEWDPASGWYVRGEIEKALRTTQTRPEAASEPRALQVGEQDYDGRWLMGSIDIRRYNRISPSSRLNLRLAGASSINGERLPPQRQHALGGEGTLPAFPLFAMDCGARVAPVSRGAAGDTEFYPRYGCDGFALAQVEYRGDLSFRIDLGGWGEDEDAEYAGEGEWAAERGLHANFGWVLFFDAGRGWSGVDGFDEPTAVDVGAGILLGDLGIYLAVPVAEHRDRGGLNFFIRLAPRF